MLESVAVPSNQPTTTQILPPDGTVAVVLNVCVVELATVAAVPSVAGVEIATGYARVHESL